MSTLTIDRERLAAAFHNERLTEFGRPDNDRLMREALSQVHAQLGRDYPLIVGGQQVRTEPSIISRNPARTAEIVGTHHEAPANLAGRAVEAALQAFQTWQYESVETRAGLLLRAAQALRERKFEFSAWLVYEVGKNW